MRDLVAARDGGQGTPKAEVPLAVERLELLLGRSHGSGIEG